MNLSLRQRWPLLLALALSLSLTPAAALRAQIESVTRVTAKPALYARVDFVVLLTGHWTNPYRSHEVQLDLEVTAPSGKRLVVPGYFERGQSDAPSVWHVRYAPTEVGRHTARCVLRNGRDQHDSAPVAFPVAASDRKGFLHAAGPWILRFDNGEPFRGIGENICWESRAGDNSRFFKALHEHPRFNYEYLLGQLSTHGGNFTRAWMCAWNFPLEWSQVTTTDRYTDSAHHFNPSAIQRLDEVVELLESADVHLMLALDPHGSFLGAGWERNNYNVKNGGPVATAAEFFTNAEARARYKDRLRYLVARWGYSPHVAVWEFFNEIDNAMYGQKPERISDEVITAWHTEMSAYLAELDPYDRPITTSISHRDVAGLNDIATIDLNQKHIYRQTHLIPETLRRYGAAHDKPYVIGEFGYEWDWHKDFNEFADLMDRDFKHGLWLGLFSPTPILPMSWWWEFFDERKLTPYFASVREISDRMLKAGGGEFAEVECSGGDFVTLAVRCGATTFVYVFNGGANEATTDVHLTAAGDPPAQVDTFDPESRLWTAASAPVVHDGGIVLAGVSLRPNESRIFALR